MDRGEKKIHLMLAGAARKPSIYKEAGRGKGGDGSKRRWGKTSPAEGTERLRLRGRKSGSQGAESGRQPGTWGTSFCPWHT